MFSYLKDDLELEEGDKFFAKGDELKEVKGASMDLSGIHGQVGGHFKYLNDPTEEQKEVMMKAIKYLNPTLDRELFEKLKVYADFYFSPEHGFKFVDYFEGKDVDIFTKVYTEKKSEKE